MSANNPQPTELNAATASSTQTAPAITRCRATNRSGRRCRLHANPHSGFCPRHALRPFDQPEDVDVSHHFGTQLDDLSTAFHINDFITTLVRLLVKNEISSRRAAVIGYLTNQLLRSVPAVDRELNPVADESQIILALSGPKPRPEPTSNPVPEVASPVVAGLQTRAASPSEGVILSNAKDLLFSSSPAPTHATTSDVILSNAKDLLLSSSPAPPPQTIAPTPTPPQTQPPAVIYRDPNYDDHWFPTAHVIKTADETERQRFAPKSPHQDAAHNAGKPACSGRPAG